ncbi:MAG: sigma-54 dependent transcriptional regulator [Gemmataceae bacterium]
MAASRERSDILKLHRPEEDSAAMLVAVSSAMRQTLRYAERVAASDAPVLVEGESGVGKELLARLIHRNSSRSAAPFVSINCAAVSETLVESELFGHEKGAFTGADCVHAGRFERAKGGTLLLDEIGEMPLKLQAKLLRVLEEKEFERVGGRSPIRTDVRVISTTNRDLFREASQGGFRLDLFYRLNVVSIRIPPLRDRRDDVMPLAEHFLAKLREDGVGTAEGLTDEAKRILLEHAWPGNVREIRNAMFRAVLLAEKPMLDAGDFSLHAPISMHGEATLDDVERQAILHMLQQTKGNKTAAAIRLGVTPRTLANKLKRWRNAA